MKYAKPHSITSQNRKDWERSPQMNKALMPLEFGDSSVRVVDIQTEAWWVLTDVCQVLGLSNPSMVAAKLDDYQKDDLSITDTIGREQMTTIINESGLYSVIFTSRKPVAKDFSRWVTTEVLPSIRRHGHYDLNPRPTVQEQVTLQKELDRLLINLERAKSAEIRQAIIGSIEATCARLNRPAPDATMIGSAPSAADSELHSIWATVDVLIENGQLRNHHRLADKGLIALNMPEVEAAARKHGSSFPNINHALKQALKESQAPRFIAIKAINSPYRAATYCWLFQR
ncbi:MAG: BRO family protein [Asticcacaulis sp.]